MAYVDPNVKRRQGFDPNTAPKMPGVAPDPSPTIDRIPTPVSPNPIIDRTPTPISPGPIIDRPHSQPIPPQQPVIDKIPTPVTPGGPALERGGTIDHIPETIKPGTSVVPEDGGMRPPVIDKPHLEQPQSPPPYEDMGNNLVKFADGTVVPKDHPLFAQKTGSMQGAAAGGGGAGEPPKTVAGAFQQALLSKLTADPNNVGTNSPELRGAVDANRLASQRSAERQRQAVRERQVAQGITGGGADTEMAGIEQNRGQQEAAFEGNLVANAAKQRRDELLQYAALAGNQLSQEQARDLQRELAMLDADIRKQGIALQGSLGGRDLDLRDKLGTGNLNLGLLGLLSGNANFDKSLGAQLGMFGANLNQNALLQMLGQL